MISTTISVETCLDTCLRSSSRRVKEYDYYANIFYYAIMACTANLFSHHHLTHSGNAFFLHIDKQTIRCINIGLESQMIEPSNPRRVGSCEIPSIIDSSALGLCGNVGVFAVRRISAWQVILGVAWKLGVLEMSMVFSA
jgi:hypothetical protein